MSYYNNQTPLSLSLSPPQSVGTRELPPTRAEVLMGAEYDSDGHKTLNSAVIPCKTLNWERDTQFSSAADSGRRGKKGFGKTLD